MDGVATVFPCGVLFPTGKHGIPYMEVPMLHQLEVLKNLRPETVVAIEGVAFTLLANALPGVMEASYSIDQVAADAENYLDVTEQLDFSPDIGERMVVTKRYIVAGGLCYDHDTDSPLKSDCANGSIYHRNINHRGSKNEQASFYDALGLDGYGDHDLVADAVSDELAKHVTATIQKDHALMSTLSDMLRVQGGEYSWDAICTYVSDAIHREGWEYAKDYITNSFLGLRQWSSVDDDIRDRLSGLVDLLTDSEAESAWKRAKSLGLVGNALALPLSIYEHSGISYRIERDRDVRSCDAVWVPDSAAVENLQHVVLQDFGFSDVTLLGAGWDWYEAIERVAAISGLSIDRSELNRRLVEAARHYANGVVEEFNSWASGDVYGVVVNVVDRMTGERIADLDEACWGYIGQQYAEDALNLTMLSIVSQLINTQ